MLDSQNKKTKNISIQMLQEISLHGAQDILEINFHYLVDPEIVMELPRDLFKKFVNLKKITIKKLPNLRELPHDLFSHNPKLEMIELSDLKSIRNLPHDLFKDNRELESVKLSDLNSLENLPSDLFKYNPQLKSIELSELKNLDTLPTQIFDNLVDLESLNLYNCLKLTKLTPDLFDNHPNLKYVGLRYCQNLTELPVNIQNLQKLTKIDLTGCRGFKGILSLLEERFIFSESGDDKEVAKSKSFSLVSLLINEILNAYKEYYSDNKDRQQEYPSVGDYVNYPIYSVFFQELRRESQFGLNMDVVNSAIPIVKAISSNRSILEYAHQSFQGRYDLSPNQFLLKFIELANLVEISQKQTLEDKLEACQVLLCCDQIKQAIKNTYNQDETSEILAQVIIRVHKKLQTQGVLAKKWLGVPRYFYSNSQIGGLLENLEIEPICGEVTNVLDCKSPSEVSEFMQRGVFKDFWNVQIKELSSPMLGIGTLSASNVEAEARARNVRAEARARV